MTELPIPFCDIGRENLALRPKLTAAYERVMRSGRVLMGPDVEAFEHELAEWFGVPHAVAVASGTDAVEIALRAIGHTGCDVVTAALTAVPTANAIEAAGCTLRLADVDASTRNVTRGGRGPEVRVSLYGQAAPPGGPGVIEDIAHAMGAKYGDGSPAGATVAPGAVSFYPTKILGALGDGGAIITSDASVAERARSIRHYGTDAAGDVTTRGQNSRMSELQAAFLRAKLPFVRDWIERRRAIAERYTHELGGRVTTPAEPDGSYAVYHVYVIEHPERDRIKAALEAQGIGTMIHYPRAIHEYARWRHLGETGQFPVAERLARTVLSLPCYPYLTDAEQGVVIDAMEGLT